MESRETRACGESPGALIITSSERYGTLHMAVSLSELLQLPVEERLKLVEALWDSIAEFPEALELSAAQKQELDRRLADYERDPEAGVPWAELKQVSGAKSLTSSMFCTGDSPSSPRFTEKLTGN